MWDPTWGGIMRPMQFHIRVPNDPMSVSVVRNAVSAAAGACGDETAQIVSLLFTELVTNALVHGGLRPDDRIEVDLTLSPTGLRGRVSDPGPGFEIEKPPRPGTVGGFGLFILDRSARNWGVDRSEGRTEVWFEL